MAVANSVEAVQAGAIQVQGTMNGIGERTGNADLVQIIPNLELKLGLHCIGSENLRRLTILSRYVYETVNVQPRNDQPFVGRSAFTHKAGLHASAVARNPITYEHVPPETVGNERRVLVSELSGRSNILALSGTNLENDHDKTREVLERLMDLENRGYAFENAQASFDLLVRKIVGSFKPSFDLKSCRVISEFDRHGRRVSEATVKVEVGGVEHHSVSEGKHGPVNAIDQALRKALLPEYPDLKDLRLVDYRVHIVNAQAAAAAKVRVVINSTDHKEVWGTVGVSENIIEASCFALVDSIEYMLNKNGK
jgi:2-isopropylmalate synthase